MDAIAVCILGMVVMDIARYVVNLQHMILIRNSVVLRLLSVNWYDCSWIMDSRFRSVLWVM